MIVPVFLPHLGCGRKCIYCNQDLVTAVDKETDLASRIEKALAPCRGKVEVGLYGGNILGLEPDQLERLLGAFEPHQSKILALRISTKPAPLRPECIPTLKKHCVKTIELGIPSFNNDLLDVLGRDHSVEDLYRAYNVLTEEGFRIGLQVMVGLPGETAADIRSTTEHLHRLRPSFIRIYPLVVLKETPLSTIYRKGEFRPARLDQAVDKALYIYLTARSDSIEVVKMGLTDNDLMRGSIEAGPFHPAFGYLVRARAFLLAVTRKCAEATLSGHVSVCLNHRDIPHLTGFRGSNLKELSRQGVDVTWEPAGIEQGSFRLRGLSGSAEGTIADAMPMIPL